MISSTTSASLSFTFSTTSTSSLAPLSIGTQLPTPVLSPPLPPPLPPPMPPALISPSLSTSTDTDSGETALPLLTSEQLISSPLLAFSTSTSVSSILSTLSLYKSLLSEKSSRQSASPPPPPPSYFTCSTPVNNASLRKLNISLKRFGTSNQNLTLWKPFDYHSSDYKNSNAHFMFISHIQQVGPQCGFAALAMVASSAGLFLSPDYLVSEAKTFNITNNGEMFSARCMAMFAAKILIDRFDVILKTHSISGHMESFKQYIHEHSLIMIPYDADMNHEPVLKRGHRAHWAIICGYVDGNSEDNFYVIARHGKSAYPALWKFSDLQESNDNLCELAPRRKADRLIYTLPDGSVKEGLASKWILFKRKYL